MEIHFPFSNKIEKERKRKSKKPVVEQEKNGVEKGKKSVMRLAQPKPPPSLDTINQPLFVIPSVFPVVGYLV